MHPALIVIIGFMGPLILGCIVCIFLLLHLNKKDNNNKRKKCKKNRPAPHKRNRVRQRRLLRTLVRCRLLMWQSPFGDIYEIKLLRLIVK